MLPLPALLSPTSSASALPTLGSLLQPPWKAGAFGGRLWEAWREARLLLYRAVLKSALLRQTSLSVARSLFGHIRTRRAIEHQSVDLGPALQRSLSGHLVPCTRTVARSDGTEFLLTKYPWADLVDLQIFLLGFDEGARWAERNTCSASSIADQSCTPPSDSATPEPSTRDRLSQPA